jgi:hypothetical protein
MDEYNKRGRGSPDPSLGSLEEESSLFSHDSGDADDFDMELLFYSDDDSDYQSPVDELTLEEEERREESAPFNLEKLIQLPIARQEVGRRLVDDSISSDDDSTTELAETTNKKPPVVTSVTNKKSTRKKSSKNSNGRRGTQNSIISANLCTDRCVFFSIDLEHGGDNAGILELSVEAFTRVGEKLGEPFDMYVKPPDRSSIPAALSNVHGLTLDDPRIKNASGIHDVWPQFKQYIESKLENGRKRASWWHGVVKLVTASGSSVSLKCTTLVR